MRRFSLLLLAIPFLPFATSAPPAPKADAPPEGFHQVRLNGHTFTLPVGFTIELVAGADLAPRPISIALDGKGRLYVTDSSGSNEKTAIQLEKKPHRVLRLEDTNGDGKYDQQAVYVPNIMFPEGAMWLDGSLYVAAPPQIMKFTDTNDDGKADKEEVWFDGKSVGGCANDLHGPYLGPDGYVYWCKGAWAEQEYTLPNGKKWKTRASHIFRAKPDGTGIEPVMTGGMDNPVGLAFMPAGERILSCTFFQHPADGKRDGLIHAVYGGVYGKDHAPIYDHPRTGPDLMPVLTHMGPAAPCGLHRLESDQFGEEYKDNLFCCQFNLRKVSRHVLTRDGATFKSKDSDFLTSDNRDFHPTDVIEDADGSLLVVDTGGWYKLCCPTSQLVKPDVTGGIYRVKKVGSHKLEDPRGLKIDWKKATAEEMAKLLDDPRVAVRWRAVDELAKVDKGSRLALLDVMANDRSQVAKQHAVWAACRITDAETRKAVAESAILSHGEVKATLFHMISLLRVPVSELLVLTVLKPDEPLAVVRAAAESVGRVGGPDSVRPLMLRQNRCDCDRATEHSLIYALIELCDAKETSVFADFKVPRIRRAALTALDQMHGPRLDPKLVLDALDVDDASLREAAWWIASRHPEWGDQLAGYFAERLKGIAKMTPPEQDQIVARMTPFMKSEPVRKIAGDTLSRLAGELGTCAVLRGMARSGLKTLPAEWIDGIRTSLSTGDPDTVRDALAVLRSAPPTAGDAADLLQAVRKYRALVRREWPKEFDYALRAVAPAGARTTLAEVSDAIADVHRDRTGAVRSAAADLLTRVALIPEAMIALAEGLKYANPAEVGKLLGAFAKLNDERAGLALVAALSHPTVSKVIRIEQVKPIFDKCPPTVREAAEKLYAMLGEARKAEYEKLERLVTEMPAGDIRRGQLVFNGAKANCVACHKIGYVGGLVGPDLTRVGNIRNERDLLEAIVFPSASFVRSYEPVRVVTADGRTLNGILKTDTPEGIVLVVAADKEERIARADIDELTPGTVSVMPAGFEQQLTPQDIADLVAFLKACK